MATIDGFILSAGLGTRMGPLSRVLPKPAWTLRGRPLLQWGAEDLRRAGLRRLACNAHLHPDRLQAAAGDLEVFVEPVLLGSAGGLLAIRSRAADPLAVWNGDAIAEVPWLAFRDAHLQSGADLSWLLVPHPGGPWTEVWLDESNRVLRTRGQGRGPFLFTGASFWSRKTLSRIPDGPSDVGSMLQALERHAGVVVESMPWREIGTPGALMAAAAALAPGEEGRLPGSYVHPDAIPAGRLDRCVLGPGARPHPALEDQDAFWFEESGRQVRLALS